MPGALLERLGNRQAEGAGEVRSVHGVLQSGTEWLRKEGDASQLVLRAQGAPLLLPTALSTCFLVFCSLSGRFWIIFQVLRHVSMLG